MTVSTTTFCQRPDCVTRSIGDETIVVPVRSHVAGLDSIYTLNEVGSVIWGYLARQTSSSQIVRSLCETYDVTAEEATQDTVDFLQLLEAAGLVTATAICER